MKNVTKLIMKNVQLRIQNKNLQKETNKAIKKMNHALDELHEMQDNNVFLIDENDTLKGVLRKYQAKEDKANGKKLKNKLDKELKK